MRQLGVDFGCVRDCSNARERVREGERGRASDRRKREPNGHTHVCGGPRGFLDAHFGRNAARGGMRGREGPRGAEWPRSRPLTLEACARFGCSLWLAAVKSAFLWEEKNVFWMIFSLAIRFVT